MTRHILITGGTGFIGHRLCQALLERGDKVTVYSRQPASKVRQRCGPVTPVGDLAAISALPVIDAVVNLAGAGIAEKRWTSARKRILYDSRVKLTDTLVQALATREQKPEILVSGSAVGFYGAQGENPVTEATPPKPEFTHELCADWESAAERATALGIRVALSRTGLVIGKDGGFMERMLPPFKLGVGGRLGNGDQYMPWIHRRDMVRALLYLLDSPSAEGPYNLVAPNPVKNRTFTEALGRTLSRPTLVPVPALALKVAFGEMATLLLTGQKAVPHRLQKEGFSFEYPELEPALRAVLGPD